MNREWSDLNKDMQALINKKDTFPDGRETLFKLRNELMETVDLFRNDLKREDFDAMPFINADGYHSKNIAYSIWHIFRIEDIVAHTLIMDDEQIFFRGDYKKRTCSPIITTGNELFKGQISEFTRQLNIDELYAYIKEVKESTERIISDLSYDDLKQKVSDVRRKKLESLDVVSTDKEAYWLIDYWCKKDIRGLIKMPFSRHWIMHIEACLRIKEKL